jgi:hypothetical protein
MQQSSKAQNTKPVLITVGQVPPEEAKSGENLANCRPKELMIVKGMKLSTKADLKASEISLWMQHHIYQSLNTAGNLSLSL